jgi:hypothetical protein
MAFLNLLGKTATSLAGQLRMVDITTSDDFDYKPFQPKVINTGTMTCTTVVVGADYFYRGKVVEYSFDLSLTLGGVASDLIYITLPVAADTTFRRCGMARINTADGNLIISETSLGGVAIRNYNAAVYTLTTNRIIGNITYKALRKR